jgi:predicted Rossmann fold flavoprotein
MHVPTEVIVIGGGGGGLIAAWRASSLGAKVLLLERNPRLGTKILISGGGKCNITHDALPEELLKAFRVREGRFLRNAMHRFGSADMIQLLRDAGLETATRDNGRVFPAYGSARDVMAVLERLVREGGTDVRTGVRVTGLTSEEGRITGVDAGDAHFAASAVILATGGVSYPKTGTTGDGYRWMESLGHTIVPLRPALAPIAVVPRLPAEWRGIAVRGGRLMVYAGDTRRASWDGDILFSHEGVTGPAALEVSHAAAVAREEGEATLRLGILPEKDFAEVDAMLADLVTQNRAREIQTVLGMFLPHRIVPGLLRSVGIEPSTRGYVLPRDDRRTVSRLLTEWTLGRIAGVSIDRGEVTAGGVSLDEVEPRTMASRKVRGLFLCGEVLDVAGPVGGYNLQAAFSTGYVAGESAAASVRQSREGNFDAAPGVQRI